MGYRCTLSPLLFLLGAIVMPSTFSAFGGRWLWAVVCGGLGCQGEWFCCVSPGVLTWICLALRHPPTVAASHWSGTPAPGIPVCSGGWRAPKWSQFYSWCIRTSLSRIASTWWPGDWLTFSGLPSPPPPAVHPLRRQRGRSAVAAGGMPPDTPASSPFPPRAGTSMGPFSCATGRRCSRPACREHCLSLAARSHGSVL